MVWCANCAKNIARPDFVEGKTCCSYCGRVLDEDNFSQEPTFVKNAGGQSQLAGNYVRTIQREISASRERTMDEARYGINSLIYALDIDGGDSIARPAEAFYGIALERNFTKGRRKEQVQAACLYISCRQNKKPYLLIDFSEHLRINVYVLGAVFLQLCKLLSLEEHPIVQKPVDPSLFIHRFTYKMFGSRNPAVSRTALQIVASMKRDWMQTGRKPGGLCGAALYISALSHGLKCTKSEIIRVVHICEATLTKRLVEFENTESGGLTIEEFNQKAEELENEERLISSLNTGVKASGITELLCRHKDSGEPHFAHGLCKSCFEDFVKISGGLDGGSEPPAFQRAERERLLAEEAAAQSSKNLDCTTFPGPVENTNELLNSDEQRSTKNMSDCKVSQPAEAGSTGANDSGNDKMHTSDATVEDTWSFSDIEDAEVDSYLNNEEEHRHKKKIWEKMNAEYIKEQEAKEKNSVVEDEETAQKRAAARKERQLKRAAEKNSGPPETAADATMQALAKKRLSSKIRTDVLKELLKEAVEQEGFDSNKKIRTEAEEETYNGKMEPELEDTRDDFGDNVEEFHYDIDGDYSQFDDF